MTYVTSALREVSSVSDGNDKIVLYVMGYL